MTASYFLLVGQLRGELGHLGAAASPPRSRCPSRSPVGCAPLLAELVEGADERRPVAPATSRPALEVLREPDRVAEQRHPLRLAALTAAGQLLGLLEREHGLAAARAAAHLDAVEQPGDLEDRGLLHGEPVGLGRALVRLGVDVVRRGRTAR